MLSTSSRHYVANAPQDTWYLTAKTYQDQNLNGATGKPNGRYYIHAINTNDLSERSNFPVPLEGLVSSNNPLKSFGGGIHHQRPGLLHYNQYIYAGFASHCAQYNFSGWIFGWDKGSGQIVEQFTTEGAGVPTSTPGGGIWMSGGGISSDGQGSMFLGTGNGYASQLNGIPVNGRSPPTALEEAALHIAINDDGSLNIVDFFMPWEKTQLDGADKGMQLPYSCCSLLMALQTLAPRLSSFSPANSNAAIYHAWVSSQASLGKLTGSTWIT